MGVDPEAQEGDVMGQVTRSEAAKPGLAGSARSSEPPDPRPALGSSIIGHLTKGHLREHNVS